MEVNYTEDTETADNYLFIPVTQTVSTTETTQTNKYIPATSMVAKQIQHHDSRRLLKVLLDSGGAKTMIHERILPPGATPTLETRSTFRTIAGNFTSNRSVFLSNLVFPEFDKTRHVDGVKGYVFGMPCKYDVILGRDCLQRWGIDLLFGKGQILWIDRCIPMKTNMASMKSELLQSLTDQTDELNELSFDKEFGDVYYLIEKGQPMLDAKYEKVEIPTLVKFQTHITETQRAKLQLILEKYPTLFDGQLGHYPHQQIHLEVEEGAVPKYSKPYPVPKMHEPLFKQELQHLMSIGVLRSCGMTEWALLTFIVPKKDGRVRWVLDFRALN